MAMPKLQLSREAVLERLRSKATGEYGPSADQLSAGLRRVVKEHFGSWLEALHAAGLSAKHERPRRGEPGYLPYTSLTEYVRARASIGGLRECWNWQGTRDEHGYGKLAGHWGGSYAHRAAYEIWRGGPADGMQLHHVCGNRCCVNPEHLREVTPLEHARLHPRASRRTRGGQLAKGSVV